MEQGQQEWIFDQVFKEHWDEVKKNMAHYQQLFSCLPTKQTFDIAQQVSMENWLTGIHKIQLLHTFSQFFQGDSASSSSWATAQGEGQCSDGTKYPSFLTLLLRESNTVKIEDLSARKYLMDLSVISPRRFNLKEGRHLMTLLVQHDSTKLVFAGRFFAAEFFSARMLLLQPLLRPITNGWRWKTALLKEIIWSPKKNKILCSSLLIFGHWQVLIRHRCAECQMCSSTCVTFAAIKFR